MSENEAPPRRKKRGAPATGADAASPTSAAAKSETQPTAPPAKQRVAKAMARAGLCSRRDAEQWVRDGRVSVNGELLDSPARDVGPDDAVVVDGRPLPAAQKTRLFLFHKPRGLVTSDHDPEGRATVADYLREHWPDGPRVVTIGRLDINTEGLLLLTNDGGLARVLELPETGWLRRYRVRARGEASPDRLDALSAGITVDGMEYAGIEARIDRQQGRNCWMTMGLREGKNREIKRVLEHLGLEVNRLIRLSFGPFQLGDLPEGAVEEVRTRVLREQLGEALAAEAGVDFEGEAEMEEGAPLRVVGRARGTIALRDRAGDGEAAPAHERPGRPERLARPPRGTGPRRHVSALRADRDDGEAPRTRVERSSTTDRRDRTVAVEHRMRAVPEKPAGRGAGARGKSHATTHLSPSAQAKRVRTARSGGERREAREGREDREGAGRTETRRFAGAGRPNSAGRGEKPMRRGAGRPAEDGLAEARGAEVPRRSGGTGRSFDGDRRPPAREFGDERRPRRDAGDRVPARRSSLAAADGDERGGERPMRGRAAGMRFRADGDASRTDDRGDRGAGRRPGGRTGGGEGGGRDFRGASGGLGAGRPSRDAADGKRAGGGYRGAKPAGRGGDVERSGGRPSSARPSGARPSGVSGGRPGGAKPSRGGPSRGGPSRGGPSRGGAPRGGPRGGSGAPRGKR